MTNQPTHSVYRQRDDIYLTVDDGRRICQHKLDLAAAESLGVSLHAASNQLPEPVAAAEAT